MKNKKNGKNNVYNENFTFQGSALVCEDDETSRLVIERHLKNAGTSVTLTSNGKTGVEAAAARMIRGIPFDIIFMDIHMPILDGLDAAYELMKMGNPSPVIALTPNISEADLINYKKHGISTYIKKPFKSMELLECLDSYLTKKDVINKTKGANLYEKDERIYQIVIDNFYNNHKNTLVRLKYAAKTGDLILAHRTAHSLRSAAAMIGALRLADASYTVEKILSSMFEGNSILEQEQLEQPLALLKREFREVFHELKTDLKKEPDTENLTNVMSRGKILKLLDKLAPLLETGNTKSLEYLDEIKQTLGTSVKSHRLLLTQIEHYDFNIACETLKEIRIKLDLKSC